MVALGVRASDRRRPCEGLTCSYGSERATGIEPASRAWEALILPLNYARSSPSLHECARRAATSCRRARDGRLPG